MNDEYTFRGQRSDEKVILIAKCNAWLLMPIVIFWLVIITIYILTIRWFGFSHITSIVLVAGVIIGSLYTLYKWYLWNGGTMIITNQRVIRTEQIGLFRREISEAEIERIQEISTEISGPIHTLLNFGTVKIQTASSSAKVDLEDVSNPYDIQQQIVRLQRETRHDAPLIKEN